jgi:hypothetical protein
MEIPMKGRSEQQFLIHRTETSTSKQEKRHSIPTAASMLIMIYIEHSKFDVVNPFLYFFDI